MEIVMLGVTCVHQSVPMASALLQFLLLPRLHWSFLFSRLDPLDPVVSMGANIFPIVLPVFEMAPKKPEDRH